MACTTILVGKNASYDGSTMIARNDDSGAGHYTPKKFVVVHPEEQPRKYKSVISHVEIDLPDNPMRYTSVPNAVAGEGVWAASGVNEANVGMTATETITSNPRVLGADPLVVYQPAEDGKEEVARGRYCFPGSAIHPPRERGSAETWQHSGAVRNLRDEWNCLPGSGRDLVAGDHRRPSLDCKKSAG